MKNVVTFEISHIGRSQSAQKHTHKNTHFANISETTWFVAHVIRNITLAHQNQDESTKTDYRIHSFPLSRPHLAYRQHLWTSGAPHSPSENHTQAMFAY